MKNYEKTNSGYENSHDAFERKNRAQKLGKKLAAGAFTLLLTAGILICASNESKPENADVLVPVNLKNAEVTSFDDDGNPDRYETESGLIIEVKKVDEGEVVVIEDNGSLRTCPAIGSPENGTRTAIMTLGESTALPDVDKYYTCTMGNNNFVGFDINEVQPQISETDLSADGKTNIVWVAEPEVGFEKNNS